MKKSGFTLIELMVVISIIALISSIVLLTVTVARDRAKNNAHVQNLVQLRNAIEAYANDHKGLYPLPDPSAAGRNGIYLTNDINRPAMIPPYLVDSAIYYTPDWIPGLVSGGYISKLPGFIPTGASLGRYTPDPTNPLDNSTEPSYSTVCSGRSPTYFYRSNNGGGYKLLVKCPEGGIISGTLKDATRPNSCYSVCSAPNSGVDNVACSSY